jgi:hypothetical protein
MPNKCWSVESARIMFLVGSMDVFSASFTQKWGDPNHAVKAKGLLLTNDE